MSPCQTSKNAYSRPWKRSHPISSFGSRHSVRNFCRRLLPVRLSFFLRITTRVRTRPPSMATPTRLPCMSVPQGSSPTRKHSRSRLRVVRSSNPWRRAMRRTTLLFKGTPSRASSSRAVWNDGNSAVIRDTRLANVGLDPSLKPSAASSGYSPEPSRPRPFPARVRGPQYNVEIHKTRPPRRRTVSGRDSGGRKGRAAWSVTFFASVLQRRLLPDLGQQAGDDLIGRLLHRLVNFDFHFAEAGRILTQALRPDLFQAVQLLVNARENLGERRNRRLGFSIRVYKHGVAPP